MSLRSLPARLARHPAVAAMAQASGAGPVVMVGEAAQALTLAAVAQATDRHPLVVAVATSAEAHRLEADLGAYLGPDAVDLFPAWETLPFERISPSIETMGRRLRAMWRLRRPERMPQVLITPVRSLVQRLGPHVEDAEPVVITPGLSLDPEALLRDLAAVGYRREPHVEHRGEVARRGSIIDVFPSTAAFPVRIDLWGDEVDRLMRFSVGDQRSVAPLDRAEIFSCRELLPTREVRARAAAMVARAPWGRAQWERLAEGQIFDGMESWLPWVTESEHVLLDLVGPDALVVLIEPRVMRNRAAEILAEEEALAASLAQTWGASRPPGDTGATLGAEAVESDAVESAAAESAAVESAAVESAAAGAAFAEAPLAGVDGAESPGGSGNRWPSLHLSFDRLLARTQAPVATITASLTAPGAAGSRVAEPALAVEARPWDRVVGDPGRIGARVAQLVADGYEVVVAAEGEASANRLADQLADSGVRLPLKPGTAPRGAAGATPAAAGGGSRIIAQGLERGVILAEPKLAVLCEGDLTGRRRSHRVVRPARREAQRFVDDLAPGDYVVHQQHGVARYGGIVSRAIGGAARDYLLLEYRSGDKLYIPSDQIDAIRHYTGGDAPTLSRLGGSDWARTKARVRSAAREVAEELVALYRTRATTVGHAFAADSVWQAEMEEGFGFIETPDQARAIAEVKADMEAERPMDRLVCGDVGFGKTEVAIRAAFKAVSDGRQVAILVPTTLLAQQHYATFSDRFAPFPTRVEVLSRFLSPAQARSVVEGLATGAVDVVVGTHRLLSSDVAFKNLGLLVIDEEQRFGVAAKEAIKSIRSSVDVLTLTATPIPRTLELSLTGIRDLSVLNTPPADRQPILTYVGEYDENAVSEALRRELLREGQVFFVHNRVSDIDAVAARLNEMVPEARVAIAHGQMDEGALERVVLDFWDGDYDVLVCTTIIESGIDMPTVNTLVVDRADLMGLGQLHQIRGRVGRAGQRAYAYLFFPPDRALSETAEERLRTIGEHNQLGSGFALAMRDLEIRGAGNLLGSSQSGHIAAVGYDLYVTMVSEAVAELKGETVEAPAEVRLDLPGDARLSADYIPDDESRLEAYRRLASVSVSTDVSDIRIEWQDRYGPPPPEADALLGVAALRAQCLRLGITDVTAIRAPGMSGPAGVVVRLGPLDLRASQKVRLARLARGAQWREDARQLAVPIADSATPGESVASRLADLLAELVPPDPVAAPA
ncbi:MAG: transcription-repair coupling factor [Acidimicrobiales bacterium]